MSIEAQEGTFQVRIRFTDGLGNYSPNFVTSSIEISTQNPITVPNVQNLMLFSWGDQVWATWEPNQDYFTKIEYQSGQSWLNTDPVFVSPAIGEL